jgi:hypothetical protein
MEKGGPARVVKAEPHVEVNEVCGSEHSTFLNSEQLLGAYNDERRLQDGGKASLQTTEAPVRWNLFTSLP